MPPDLPAPKPGQRFLAQCACCDGPGWMSVDEICGEAVHGEPERPECLCSWMWLGDWDPEVVLELRVGNALLWAQPDRMARYRRRERALGQLGLFGEAAR